MIVNYHGDILTLVYRNAVLTWSGSTPYYYLRLTHYILPSVQTLPRFQLVFQLLGPLEAAACMVLFSSF